MALFLLSGLLALGCDPVETTNAPSPSSTAQAENTGTATPLSVEPTQARQASALPDEDCFEDWGSMNGGQRNNGEWDRSCASTSRTGSFAHYYRFNLPQQIGVQIDLEASTNSYLYLLRGAEAGGTSNSQISVLLEAGEYTIEATTQERGTTGEFRVTLVPVREHVSFAPAQCPPVPVPAPGAQAIDTLRLNNADGPELANSYLSACLEGAWRQMEALGSQGLLHPVGIAVIDSGLYEPPNTDTYRNLVVQNEFDWERISVRDTVQDRVFETEDDRFRRSHHGTAVVSILAAVNHGGHSGLAKIGGGYDPSFSGVVASVPTLDYELYFYEATKSGETRVLDFGSVQRALEDIKALGDRIDVVNLSQAIECNNNGNLAAFQTCRFRVFGAPTTNRNSRYKGYIESMPNVIFVAGAGNSGADALYSTPARLSLELPTVITVGAVETNDGTGETNRWVDDQTTASNYGTPITIAAQGAELYALTTTGPDEAYRRDSGTSFAAPLVSGVAAFLRAIDPDIAAREVVEILGESSTPIPVCTVNDPDMTMVDCPEERIEHWRLLNADAAVRELLKRVSVDVDTELPVEPPPTVTIGPTWTAQPLPEQTLANFEGFNGLAEELSAAGNDQPWGIWSDWVTMWVADYEDDKIYAYDLKTKERRDNLDFNTLRAAGNELPQSIWSDGETMWVLDRDDGRVYAYHTESKARDLAKEINLGPDIKLNISPRGIWSDGETMWVSTSTGTYRPFIYAYDMETKERDEDKDFTGLLPGGNLRPEGIWSDGETMWVADSSAPKIYAYDMTTKAPVPAKEFETLAAGVSPRAIWSNGATMLVSHSSKISAYNMPASEGVTVTPPTVVQTTEGAVTSLSRYPARNHSALLDGDFGIRSDWSTMWVWDNPAPEMYTHSMATTARAESNSLNFFCSAKSNHHGSICTHGKTSCAVASIHIPHVLAYEMTTRKRKNSIPSPALPRLPLRG